MYGLCAYSISYKVTGMLYFNMVLLSVSFLSHNIYMKVDCQVCSS